MAKKFSIADVVQASAGKESLEVAGEVMKIPREKITANDKNFYAMDGLEELAASIELAGLIHPIIVKPSGEGYTLVDGERRFRAMGLLEWPECPAIIHRPANDVLEELMLIEANRNQRKLSDADLARQAERYTELLSQLRDAGVEIPGRLRERVAEAMQISASKLARLHKIKTSLIEPLAEKFDAGQLNESIAYELAKRPEERQRLFVHKKPENLTADMVRDLSEYADTCFSDRDCPYGGICDYGGELYKAGASKPYYKRCTSSYSYRNGCCKTCPDRRKCPTVCPKAAPTVNAERAKAAKEAADLAAERDRERLRGIAAADADWKRIKALRKSSGVDIEQCSKIIYGYELYESRENRDTWSEERTFRDAVSIDGLIKFAELFNVSADVLLGRDSPQPDGLRWHDGAKEPPNLAEPDYSYVVCWGNDGRLKALQLKHWGAYYDGFPELYRWWAYVAGPEEAKNT